MCGRSCGAMPMPVSVTSRRTTGPSRRALTTTRPPAGVYLMALSTQIGQHLTKTPGIGRHGQIRPRPPSRRRCACLRRRSRTARPLRRRSCRPPASLTSRRMVPVSASEMSINVSSMARMRSDSSRLVTSASRCTCASSDCSARSATPRRRVIGVRRSCATLSRACSMPRISVVMRSSISLNSALSSSMASRSVRTGTRASMRPVRMMPRTAVISRRIGCSVERVTIAPPASPSGDDDERHDGEHGPKSCEECFAVFAALTHLKERAVGQPRDRDFEPRRARFGQDSAPARPARAAD